MGRGDVLVQQAQGRGARCAGEVELGKLALGEGRGRPLPISCFATLLRRDKSLVVVNAERSASPRTDAIFRVGPRRGDTVIVDIHKSYRFRHRFRRHWKCLLHPIKLRKNCEIING